MGRYELVVRAGFSAAHGLRLADGRAEPLHEHDWQVEAFLEGTGLDCCGMVADFEVLRRDLTEITGALHGACLNELPAFSVDSPSAELVAKHVHDRYRPTLPATVRLVKLRVWETRDCAAAYLPSGSAEGGIFEPDAARDC